MAAAQLAVFYSNPAYSPSALLTFSLHGSHSFDGHIRVGTGAAAALLRFSAGRGTIRAHGPGPDRTGRVTPGMVTWGADETLLPSTRSGQR